MPCPTPMPISTNFGIDRPWVLELALQKSKQQRNFAYICCWIFADFNTHFLIDSQHSWPIFRRYTDHGCWGWHLFMGACNWICHSKKCHRLFTFTVHGFIQNFTTMAKFFRYLINFFSGHLGIFHLFFIYYILTHKEIGRPWLCIHRFYICFWIQCWSHVYLCVTFARSEFRVIGFVIV